MILSPFGSGHADQRFAGNPSGDGFAFGLGVIFVGVFSRFAEDGFDVSPVAAGLDDDEFVSAPGFAELGGVGAGGDADGFFVDERAALRLGGGERRCGHECEREQSESKVHIHDYWP